MFKWFWTIVSLSAPVKRLNLFYVVEFNSILRGKMYKDVLKNYSIKLSQFAFFSKKWAFSV